MKLVFHYSLKAKTHTHTRTLRLTTSRGRTKAFEARQVFHHNVFVLKCLQNVCVYNYFSTHTQTHTHKTDAATLVNVYISLNVSGN